MKIKKMIIKIILMIFEFFENNTIINLNSIKEYGKNETIKDLLIFEENKNEENNESYNTDNNKDAGQVLLKEKKKIV